MGNPRCLTVTDELKDLAAQMEGESLGSVITLVELWQEKYNKEYDEYPTVGQLKALKGRLKKSDKELAKRIRESVQMTKSLLAFPPQIRNLRINYLSRVFSRTLDNVLQDEKDNLLELINNIEDLEIKQQYQNLYDTLTRLKVLRARSVDYIFDLMKQELQQYIDTNINSLIPGEIENAGLENTKADRDIARENIKYKKSEYQKILDNFDALIPEISAQLAVSEGIELSKMPKESHVINESEETSWLEQKSDHLIKEEAPKDIYDWNFREISAYESLSTKVREVLRSIPMLDTEGYYQMDDLGNCIYLSPAYAHAILQDKLTAMSDSSDFIPMLQELAKTNLWVEQLLERFEEDKTLIPLFYQNFRKDFTNYFATTSSEVNGVVTQVVTNAVNRKESVMYWLNKIKANIEQGVKLTNKSIYDSSGTINKDNARDLLQLLNRIKSSVLSNQDFSESDLANINFLLQSVGLNIDLNMLSQSLESKTSRANILNNLTTILTITSRSKVTSSLFKNFQSAYKGIASNFNSLGQDFQELSFMERGKSYTSYTIPNYLGRIIKELKNVRANEEKFKQFLEKEFKQFDWFYDRNSNHWFNSWLRLLEEDPKARENLNCGVMLHKDGKSYNRWEPLDTMMVMMAQFMNGSSVDANAWSWYHLPLVSDANSSEWIRFRRYNDNLVTGESYKSKILDDLYEVVIQEINRIAKVKDRARRGVSEIDCYDMTSKSVGGAEFKFFDELNHIDEFLEKVQSFIEKKQSPKEYVTQVLQGIMDARFQKTQEYLQSIGFYENDGTTFKYTSVLGINKTEEAEQLFKLVENFVWNDILAQTQIIELLFVDPAFAKNSELFTKRFKGVYSPALRIYNEMKPTERVVYLSDEVVVSSVLEDVKEVLDIAKKEGRLTTEEYNSILDKYQNCNLTDGQAYRTLDSYKAIQEAQGRWTNEMEATYQRFLAEQWSYEDFMTIFQPIKPFLYTTMNLGEGIKGPVMHKNSEYLLLAASAMISHKLHSNWKLRALDNFMKKHNIDAIDFVSAVKVGAKGVVDTNSATNEQEFMEILEEMAYPEGVENSDVVHTIDMIDWGNQTELPEHVIDAVQNRGTQMMKLILGNLPVNFTLEVNGKTYTRKQLQDLFNGLNISNIFESYNSVEEIMEDPEKLSEVLKQGVLTSGKYSVETLQASSLNEDGEFTVPMIDPAMNQRESMVLSLFKNRIIRQKTKGGTFVQVSNFGYENNLHIVFEGSGKNKRIKYVEVYVNPYSEQFKDLLPRVNGTFDLDVNRLPEELRNFVAYRIPTEAKYSMFPCRIKGFLPYNTGTSIMMPNELTSISDADFDSDKMYVMLPEFDVIKYDSKKAKEDYEKESQISETILNLFKTSEDYEVLEQDEDFKEWFNERKEQYAYKIPKIKYIKPGKRKNIRSRNNELLEMFFNILTTPEATLEMLMTGGFDKQRRTAKIVQLLLHSDFTFKDLNKLSLDELKSLYDKYVVSKDLLSPDTFVRAHEKNMAGKNLIGIAAIHNPSHTMFADRHIEIVSDKAVNFNGVIYNILDNIYNEKGELIAKNLAGYIPAATDNGKDPVLGDMNINLFTANVAYTMIRMGISPITVGLFMSQPIIKHMVMQYNRRSLSETKTDVLEKVLLAYKDMMARKQIGNIYENVNNFTEVPINDEFMASQLQKPDLRFQYYYGKVFMNLMSIADDLASNMRITRTDNFNMVGKSIANVLLQKNAILDYMEKSNKKGFSFKNMPSIETTKGLKTKEEKLEVVKKSELPYLQAFYSFGVEPILSLSRPYYNYTSEEYQQTLRLLNSDYLKTPINNEELLYEFFTELTIYNMSMIPIFQNANKSRMIHIFPRQVISLIKEIPELSRNELLKNLRIIDKNGVPLLILSHTGKMTQMDKNNYTKAWAELLYHPNIKVNQLALDLAVYSYLRTGTAYNRGSFGFLMPIIIKQVIPKYLESLRDINTNPIGGSDFIEQYIMNHLNNPKFVAKMEVSKEASPLDEKGNIEDNITIDIECENPMELSESIRPLVQGFEAGMVSPMPFISFNTNKGTVYYKLETSDQYIAVYNRVYPLGLSGEILQYDANTIAENMSPITEVPSEIQEELRQFEEEDNESLNRKLSAISNYTRALEQSLQEYANQRFSDVNTNENYRDAEGNTICK